MSVAPNQFVKLPVYLEGDDLYKLLDISPSADNHDVDDSYSKIIDPNFNQYVAWKLLRDPAYSSLYAETRSMSTVIKAGFFIDKIDFQETSVFSFDSKNFVTPVYKIQANMQKFKDDLPPVVLLCTGAFSPIHYGHLSMMETAKKTLESLGRNVVGGYISPSHDAYVSQKYDGDAALPAAHRVHIARKSTDASDWLMIDPWESEYLPTDVNFTDVIRHIKDHLNFCFSGTEFDVYYVFGADNAEFARVLQFTDGGICISRSSTYNPRPDVFKEPSFLHSSRLTFVRSDDPASDFSSTVVRKWKPLLMPRDASVDYFGWKKTLIMDDLDVPLPPQNYIVRDDLAWALEQYYEDELPKDVVVACDVFRQGLKELIETTFQQAMLPDRNREVRVYFYEQKDQYTVAKSIERASPTLNLDTATNDGQGINFSRRFELADSQFRPTSLIARPGFPSMDDQVSPIVSGDYTFLDDDIASGATLNLLMGILPEDVRISSIKTLFSHSRRVLSESNQHECLDVIDTRDFLLGAKAGGLVVGSPAGDGLMRVPYMEPFVNLNSRAFIPLSMCRNFSLGAWQLNKVFFESIDRTITLKQATTEFRDLMTTLGFSESTPLHHIAEYYINELSVFNREEVGSFTVPDNGG